MCHRLRYMEISLFICQVLCKGEELLASCDRDEKIRLSHYPNAHSIYGYCLGHTELVLWYIIHRLIAYSWRYYIIWALHLIIPSIIMIRINVLVYDSIITSYITRFMIIYIIQCINHIRNKYFLKYSCCLVL